MERVLAMALFDTLYFMYFKEVFQYVKNRVQNQEIAKDITQDVFVKACENKEFVRELNKTKIKEKLINAAQDLCEEFLQKQQVIPLTVLIVGLLVTIAGSLISPGIVDVAEGRRCFTAVLDPHFWQLANPGNAYHLYARWKKIRHSQICFSSSNFCFHWGIIRSGRCFTTL